MSYINFPNKLWVKTINTGEDILTGGFKLNDHMDLQHMIVYLLIKGEFPTTETAKLEVHRNNACTSLYCTSNTINLSDIKLNTKDYLVKVRFDFNKQPINKNFYYYPKIILSNYTRSSSYFLGVVYDWPVEVYSTGSSNPLAQPLKTEIFGYRYTV